MLLKNLKPFLQPHQTLSNIYGLATFVRAVDARLYFIFLSILFSVSFHLLSLLYLGLGWSVTSHVTWYCHRMVTSCHSHSHKIM